MSSRFNFIAQYLFQKDLANCTVDEIQAFADSHPYSAPGQFLLAKKLQQTGAPGAQAQFQKAALYYHQPAAFDAFFNEEALHFATLPSALAGTKTVPEHTPLPAENIAPPETSLPEQESAENEKVETVEPEAAAAPEPEAIAVVQNAEPAPDPAHTAPELQHEAAENSQTAPQAAAVHAPEEPLAFEPFHTVDYFASQGIKLRQEEIGKDKFGKQLKSFTEWLKTMKKLPANEQAKGLDTQSEQNVTHLAEHSVAGSDVLTETMAEVWLKQGNKEKAAEVYHKLSLLNPSKRAYFAAKLENLKK